MLPPQETVSSAALGVVLFRQKDKRENTEEKIFLRSISATKTVQLISARTFALLLTLLWLTILRLSRPFRKKVNFFFTFILEQGTI